MPALSTRRRGDVCLFGWYVRLNSLLSVKEGGRQKARATEDRQSYEDCLRDLVLSRPHAFANEMDVQYLLQMYPSGR